MSTDDQGRKPAAKPLGEALEREHEAGARYGTLHAHPASLTGPDAPRVRPNEPPAPERASGTQGGTLLGVNRAVWQGSSQTVAGMHVSKDGASPPSAADAQAQPPSSAAASSDWLEDMSAFLRTETPSPVRNPFSVRTESQVSKTHPVLTAGTVRGVAAGLPDDQGQPRTASAVAPAGQLVAARREPSADDTVGRHELNAPSANDTVGRHELHSPSANDTVGRHELHSPSPNDTVGRHELNAPSANDTVGRHELHSPSANDTVGRHELRAGSPDDTVGRHDAPFPHHANVPALTDSAGVMRRVRRRPGLVSGTSATATPTHAYSRSHTEDPASPGARLKPVVGSVASGSYNLPVTAADPLSEEGDMGGHAEDRAARPLSEHEQVTRTVDAPSDLFSKALRLDDTLVDRPVVPDASPDEAPQGTVRGVDWRPSTDDRAATTTGDAVAAAQDATRAVSPLASLPTAPMTRPPASADRVDEFGETQSAAIVSDAASATPSIARSTERLSWQDAMSGLAASNAPLQASLLDQAGEDGQAAPGVSLVTDRNYGAMAGRASATAEGSGAGHSPKGAASASTGSPSPPTAVAVPGGRPATAQPSALVARLRSMGLPAMSRDTIVALVVGITVLFVALLFLFWVLAQ